MPLIQITLPENALDESQQAQLAEQTTDILLSLEAMAANPKARRLTWTCFQTHPQNAFLSAEKVINCTLIIVLMSPFLPTHSPQKRKRR
jgi:Uncharacterized protein, 4-oxalocrotonate tautomerase homolog